MSVKGFWALRLDDYCRGADPAAITAMSGGWGRGGRAFNTAGDTMGNNASKASNGFSETSASGSAIKRLMVDSSGYAHRKRDKVQDAMEAIDVVATRVSEAMIAKAEIDQALPGSHPSVNAAEFPTDAKQVGKRQAEENDAALAQARADHAAREAAIADAERKAAAKVQAVDASVVEADPKVRALVDPDNTRQERPSGSPSVPGSYSAIAAAQARKSKINANVTYPDGWGWEKIAAEDAKIKDFQAENRLEWDNKNGQWINADGSLAPATSYAMVESEDGLAPLSGGPGGAAALAVGAGGALLGAGVAKAIASKFGAGKAGAPSSSVKSAAKTGTVKPGSAGARPGAPGSGARTGGTAGRGGASGGKAGKGKNLFGSGSRNPAKAGASTAAGRGGKKDDETSSQDQEYVADYTEHWIENSTNVWDPNMGRGWVPNPPTDEPDEVEKNDKPKGRDGS